MTSALRTVTKLSDRTYLVRAGKVAGVVIKTDEGHWWWHRFGALRGGVALSRRAAERNVAGQ